MPGAPISRLRWGRPWQPGRGCPCLAFLSVIPADSLLEKQVLFLEWGRDSGGSVFGEEFFWVVGSSGFEDAEDGVQQFACDGDQGLEFCLLPCLQPVVEVLHPRVEAGRRQCRHVEGAAQMT